MHRIRHHARALRNDCTDAEQLLWQYLRRRQLGGFRFRRQHPLAGCIADFACMEARLTVELDGGQHLENAEYDARRTQRLNKMGYRVLRFWNDDVLLQTETVLEVILHHLEHPDSNAPTNSSPCLQGEVGRG